ncbi:hypothetical protein M6B38_310295 [Iris pallida]|uniref:Uncharacterized protein n=1 Tax=Iris pallida TaxID=29817 RepID=A0AAX6HJP3_IRIPA|nr:hypothetical protein M6B38_310295 [Iris pallida]
MHESLWNIGYRKGEHLGAQAARTWDNCIRRVPSCTSHFVPSRTN